MSRSKKPAETDHPAPETPAFCVTSAKGSMARVAIQAIGSVTGYEEVGVTVVVEVCGRYTHAVVVAGIGELLS